MITDPTERSDVLPYLEVRLRFIRRVNHSGCTSFGGKMLAAVAIFGPESSDRWPARRSRGFTSEITFRKKKKILFKHAELPPACPPLCSSAPVLLQEAQQLLELDRQSCTVQQSLLSVCLHNETKQMFMGLPPRSLGPNVLLIPGFIAPRVQLLELNCSCKLLVYDSCESSTSIFSPHTSFKL